MKAKSNSNAFRFTRLIPYAHINGDSSTTSVLWLLCAKAGNDTTTCDPSALYIALKTGLSVSTVKRSINKLTTLGLIKKQIRGTSKNHEGNIYTLDYDKLTKLKTDCDEADKEHMDSISKQETTSRYSRLERAGSDEYPGHGDTDKGMVVRVISSGCPGQTEMLSGSNGGVYPVHGDTLTTVTTNTTTKELDPEEPVSGSQESLMVKEQPQSLESRILKARRAVCLWESQLAEGQLSGDPLLPVYQARAAASQRRLEGLLAESN